MEFIWFKRRTDIRSTHLWQKMPSAESRQPAHKNFFPHTLKDVMVTESPSHKPDINSDPGHPNRVLLVDDVQDNLDLMEALLGSEGYETIGVKSVDAALEILGRDSHFDLILSDISMPEKTGFDLLKAMSSSTEAIRRIPVLLITAVMPEDENRIMGLTLGAVDYIVRPISNKELVIRIQHAISSFVTFKNLRASLESSESLAMTGRMLAAANHEISNLAGLILVTSEQVIASFSPSSVGQSEIGQQALRGLTSSSRLLAQICRNMNDFIGQSTLRLRPLSLNKLIGEVADLMRLNARPYKIEFAPDEDDLCWVDGDEIRLKQVLINFILNAIDALNECGTGATSITIRITEGGPGSWRVRVVDQGIGLIKKMERYDFPPFSTTKSMRGGKGLGLWLCSQFAISMNGLISLESDGPGLGASANITLQRGKKALPPIDLSKYMD
jgi:signal transduction histidine kinase